MKPDYCTQNDGLCASCALSSYGRDCQNNKIVAIDHPWKLFKKLLPKADEHPNDPGKPFAGLFSENNKPY